MTRQELEATEWAKSFKVDSPTSYEEAIRYAMTPNLVVEVYKNEVVRELAVKIKPGGVFIFNTFNKEPSIRPLVKEYELDHDFVEVSWRIDSTVHHVQIREGMEPHHTTFKWVSPQEFYNGLAPHFDVEVKTDGGTDIYICRRKSS